MKLTWMRYMAGLQSPAPSNERRFQRAVSRVRYAAQADLRNQWTYVARCYAFRRLIQEIGFEGFREWLTQESGPDVMVFNDAVLAAVATVPLRGGTDARFVKVEFLAAVKKIASEKQ